MNVALWVVQGALAAVFAVSGAAKAVLSKERMLATGQTGVRDYSLPAIRMIAACELAAVLGLILPGLLGRGLALTPLAAVGVGDRDDRRCGRAYPASRGAQRRG